jgi:hypothetical protein
VNLRVLCELCGESFLVAFLWVHWVLWGEHVFLLLLLLFDLVFM